MTIETALRTALTAYVFFACLREIYKHKHPPACDSCKHLKVKVKTNRWGNCVYLCEKYTNSFEHAPEICSKYEPKDGGTSNV